MKTNDLRNMTKDELVNKQLSIKEELMNLRFKAKMGKLEKPSRISQIRKDIARILTILKEGTFADANTKKKA
jgi:large subunit ribosomal protein L29